MNGEQVNKLLDDYAAKLGEHFGAVQIMVTWDEGGVTHAAKRGCGNWYARQGMAHEFINCDMAVENAHQLAAIIHRPDSNDGDEWKS